MPKETELTEEIILNTERYGDSNEVQYDLIFEDLKESKQQTISEVLEILEDIPESHTPGYIYYEDLITAIKKIEELRTEKR